MQASSTENNDVSKFIQNTFTRYPNITSYKTLQKHIECYFEKDFKPEQDQIDYMRKAQSSQIYRRQTKTFKKRKTMMTAEGMSSFKNAYSMQLDKDELKDSDDSGSERVDSEKPQDDYFSGQDFNIGLEEEQKNVAAGLTSVQSNGLKSSYLERCKSVGRLGPPKTSIDLQSIYGEYILGNERAKAFVDQNSCPMIEMDGSEALPLDIEAKSNFVSARANTGIFRDCFYYEVTLLSDGLMQIGWCGINTSFSNENGVGDSPSSYAYDGYRVKKWNLDNSNYGERWSVGDVIGTLINLHTREIIFWRNMECLGVAFKDVEVGPNKCYFPAVSLQAGQRVLFNFGLRPFTKRLHICCLAINEPDCFINNFYNTGVQTMEIFRDFILGFSNEKNQSICEDDRISVGILITEQLVPIMEDIQFFESQILRLLQQMIMIEYTHFMETLFRIFELTFSDDYLKKWVMHFMYACCRDVLQQPMNSMHAASANNIIKLVIAVCKREKLRAAWLQSPYFYQDLEKLFGLHLISTQEWKKQLEVIYHPLLSDTFPNKVKYEKNFNRMRKNFDTTQKLLTEVTKYLMSTKPVHCNEVGRPQQVIPQEKFLKFIDQITQKSKELHRESQYYQANLHVEMSDASTQLANTMMNVFTCVEHHLVDLLYSQPLDTFPIRAFFIREMAQFDHSLKNVDRLGGTLGHIETENAFLFASQKVPQKLRTTQQQQEMLKIFKLLIQMFNCGLLDHIRNFQGNFERLYIRHRLLEDLQLQSSSQSMNQNMSARASKKKLLSEMKELVETSPNMKLVFLSTQGKIALTRFSTYIMTLINNLDTKVAEQDFVYAVPVLFLDIPFELFRAYMRALPGYHNYENEINTMLTRVGVLSNTSLQQSLGAFVSRHFFDEKIANPDLKETMIIRLNMFLQFQECIKTLENDSHAREHLLPTLLKSFNDHRWLCHSVKNLLRFSKGKGFKEIIYRGLKDTTYSKCYLIKMRACLLNFDDQTSQNFMNAVFNSLNDVTNELFILFKEVKDSPYAGHQSVLRRVKYFLDLIIDLSRVLELLTRWVPELFLNKECIHAGRLLDFTLFVFRSIFRQNLDTVFIEFCNKLQSRSRTLPQFLAPFIGIITNLYKAIAELSPPNSTDASAAISQISTGLSGSLDSMSSVINSSLADESKGGEDEEDFEIDEYASIRETIPFAKERSSKAASSLQFDSLADFINRMSSFDPTLFKRLLEIVINELRPGNQREVKVFQTYEKMLGETEMLIMCKKVRKDSIDSTEGLDAAQIQKEKDELEAALGDDNLCPICYTRVKDSIYTPCQHISCKVCIQTHMLNNKKCPFCQTEVTGLQPMKP